MSRTVLLIEDEPTIAKGLHVRLLSRGYAVLQADNGQDGLTAARTHCPDVILLDICLPDINGCEVCRKLKAESTCWEIPIIAFSADTRAETRTKAKDAGAVGFIAKPYDAVELIEMIERVCTPIVSGTSSGASTTDDRFAA